MLKRCLDLILACIGLALTLPFLPFIALLIKLNSRGPVFYRCDRVGKGRKIFKMYKFRTMYETPEFVGPSVSSRDDPRVTPFGRFLRRTKINEFPQLLNILKGEMTFVGPRPEAPNLADLYPVDARDIFAVTPGLVGPNQILGRNEEEWYPPGVDPEQYYIEVILPKKLPLDLEYACSQPSLCKDLQYLVRGVKETVCKAISWKLVLQNRSQIYLLGADFVLSMVSFGLAHLLRFGWAINAQEIRTDFLQLLPVMVLIRIPCFFYFGLYKTLIRYIAYVDILHVFKGISASSMLFIGLTFLFDFRTFSRAVLLIDVLCLFVFMTALRLALRLFREWQVRPSSRPKFVVLFCRLMAKPLKRMGWQIPLENFTGVYSPDLRPQHAEEKRKVFIFGAGNAGILTYRFLQASQEAYEVIGFLDDQAAKRHKTLYGRKVLGNHHNLEALVKVYKPDEVLLALPSASADEIAAIARACRKAKVEYRLSPILSTGRRVQPAELLPETHYVSLTCSSSLSAILTEKRVLVAGTSGALGLELCRQILHFAPEHLLVLERYEPSLEALVSQLKQAFPTACITPILCPPAGNANLEEVFAEYRPHLVFQNAMRKYLPFFHFQAESESILRANYLTTFALAKQAARCGSTHFVLVSSEEAENRGTLIADSLRAVEIGLRQFFAPAPTRLVTVRLCDILENRGGIVARLEEQIVNREPVILPHRDAKRALLSKYAAVHFILDALGLAETLDPREGIFVCPQASAVSLLEVARHLAMLHGYQLGTNIPLYFLQEPPAASPSAEVQESDARTGLIPTSNPSISLLQESPFASSQAITKAVQELLNIQEGHLAYDWWERPTRALLEGITQVA